MFRLLLFFPLLLLSQDFFTLPDENSHYIDSYAKDLLNTKEEVIIVSSTINEYKIMNVLKKLSKKEVSIIIITQGIKDEKNRSSYLSLLKNIQVYTLVTHPQRNIKGSMTCIDDKIFYTSSLNLEHSQIKSHYAFASKKNTPCKFLFTGFIEKSIKIQ